MFMTDFMKSLAHEYWMGYLKKIIVKAFLPWVAYSLMSIIYFTHTLDRDFEDKTGAGPIMWQAGGVIILIFVAL